MKGNRILATQPYEFLKTSIQKIIGHWKFYVKILEIL